MKKNNNKRLLGLGVLAAAGVGAFFAWKQGMFNFSDEGLGDLATLPGLDPNKPRAQRWLEAKLNRSEHVDLPRAEVMHHALSMESGRAEHFAQALKRLKGDSVTYEAVSPWGVGRPE